MDRKLRKYLEDILNSINEIEFFLHTIHSGKIFYGRLSCAICLC